MRSVFGAAALGIILAVAACSPAAEKAEAPPTETAETPAATPPAAETPAGPPAATLIALDITDASGAQLSGDTERGRRIFAQCATCHSPDAGVNRVGPSLHGIIGRESGTVPGFRYSAANQASDITWTEQELFSYLENPRAKIPGTTMAFVGLRNPQQRADVIAYLQATTGD
ncbi:c-type cytochrome [Terricaulis sp.]|uniref:c-type cytochrome n=1 Tax=Terricaulis sp. TaxID=2768686 RepID=UPI002AC5744A|nr:c-type cytochrome [Terricaulis sp.]MDZ4691336.1 c-type cytochrome [Terricaulis sp.]